MSELRISSSKPTSEVDSSSAVGESETTEGRGYCDHRNTAIGRTASLDTLGVASEDVQRTNVDPSAATTSSMSTFMASGNDDISK
jgi:hypothetical protein